MSRKSNREWRWWEILLLIHLICYEAFFIGSLANFNHIWYASQNNFIILLFWTAILLLHVGTHYYHAGRANLSDLERQAYRDGFADAARQLSIRSEAIERLTLEDEDELFELPEKQKRQL